MFLAVANIFASGKVKDKEAGARCSGFFVYTVNLRRVCRRRVRCRSRGARRLGRGYGECL